MNSFLRRVLLVALFGYGSQASAAIVINENFNHIAGPLEADASWGLLSGTAGGIVVENGVAVVGRGSDDLMRPFGTTLSPLYFGLDVRVSDAAGSAYVFGFRDSSSFAARFFLADFNGGFRLGVNSGGSGSTSEAFAAEKLLLQQTYRLVGYADGLGRVSAWIDPSQTDALTPDVSLFNTDVGGFAAFYLRQGDTWDNNDASWTADNLVVATTFSEVVPVAVPEPAGWVALFSIGIGVGMRYRGNRGSRFTKQHRLPA